MRELKAEKKIRLNEAERKLLAHDYDGAKEDLLWLENYERLKRQKNKNSSFITGIIISIFIFFIVAMSLTIRVDDVIVSAAINTSYVEVDLSKPWKSERIICKDFSISDLQMISIPESGIRHESNDGEFYNAIIEGSFVELNTWSLDSGATLMIDTYGESIGMTATNHSPLDASIVVKDAVVHIDDGENSWSYPIDQYEPVRIFFKTSGTIQMVFHQFRPIKVPSIEIDRVSFISEKSPGSGILESNISNGKGKLLETETKFDITEKDIFDVEISELRKLAIHGENDQLRVELKSKVSMITMGEVGFEKNLMPNLLEYMYKNQAFALVYSLAIMLWGFLWSLRRIV